MQVRHVMSRTLTSIRPGASLLEARGLMRERHVKRVLVVDGEGHLVGVLDRRDIREQYIVHLLSAPAPVPDVGDLVESEGDVDAVLARMTVEEAMSHTPLTVRADASVDTAALLMHKAHLYGLPVLDNGRLVGMLNERAVFGALVSIVNALQREAPGLLDRVLEADKA